MDGEPKVDSSIHLNRKAAIVCCTDSHSSPAMQASTVGNSSLTPSGALLMCPRGTTHSIVDSHEFIGSQK